MAVEQFVKEKICLQEVPTFISKGCESHMENWNVSPELEGIVEVDNWAGLFVKQEIKKGKKYVSVG
jgi:1-deoxy-D-xylulose 5-phosphate reductoisomerase